MAKLIHCKVCGAEIASNANVCLACGARNKKPAYTRAWFWLLILLFFVSIGMGVSLSLSENDSDSDTNETVSSTPSASNPTVSPMSSAFAGDCGITASAEMGSSIIGSPLLNVSISNTTEKEISAIQFYAVPYDVYGEEITGWTSQHRLYTDTAIAAGESNSISFQFIEDRVKTVKLYVYSVYFADGTEWGDKEATTSTILNYGALIEVSGQS